MASDFRVRVGLDVAPSAEEIKKDIPKLQALLNKDPSARLKLIAELDLDKTQKAIKSQLKNIKTENINIKAKFSDSDVSQQLKNTQRKIAKNSKPVTIFDLSELKEKEIPYITKTANTIEKQMASIQSMAKKQGFNLVDVNGIEEVDGKIKQFTVTVRDAEGSLKRFTMTREKIKGQGKAQYGFVQTSDVKVIETATQAQEKLNTQIQKGIEKTIEARKEEEKQLQLNQDDAINKSIDDEWKKINKEIEIYHKKLDDIVKVWKEHNLYTEESEKNIEDLRNKLSQVGSKNGLNNWISDYEAYESKIFNLNKSLEAQIRLQNEINALETQKANLNPKDNNVIVEAKYDELIKEKETQLEAQKKIAESYKNIIPLAQQEQYIVQETAASAEKLSIAKEKRQNRRGIIEEKDILQFQLAYQKAEVLINRIEAFRKANPKAEKTFGKTFDGMIKDLKETPKLCDEYSRKLQEIMAKAKATGKTGNTFFGTIKANMDKFAGWMTMTGVITEAWHGMKQMVTEVKNINTEMINLQKVTDETDATYAKFLRNATKEAQKLSASVTDVIEQTSTWSKLGYSLSDAEKLSEVSMIYSKVGEVDNTTAVSDLVTVMKAFNVESENSIHIVDSLNQLGNSFATDAKSLGEGLTKSASALNAANNSFEQSIALLTGGTEITQNAAEMGSALKVISMRIRGKIYASI